MLWLFFIGFCKIHIQLIKFVLKIKVKIFNLNSPLNLNIHQVHSCHSFIVIIIHNTKIVFKSLFLYK